MFELPYIINNLNEQLVCLLVFHTYFLLGILIFKEITARRLYKLFGVKGLRSIANSYFHQNHPHPGLPNALISRYSIKTLYAFPISPTRFVRSAHLLTPWRTVLPEMVTGSQLATKFPLFYGTQRFITAFTRARHLSLSWDKSIQSIFPFLNIYRLLTFYVQNLMSIFHCVDRTKGSVQVRGTCICFVTRPVFTVMSC
jgi:hypothetical protein